MNRRSIAASAVVLIVVLSGCVGFPGGGLQSAATDTPGTTTADATTTSTRTPSS